MDLFCYNTTIYDNKNVKIDRLGLRFDRDDNYPAFDLFEN